MGSCASTPVKREKSVSSTAPVIVSSTSGGHATQESTKDKLFMVSDEIMEFFKGIANKRIMLNSICENNFQPQRSFQDVVNLYLCLRLGQYFSQEDKLFNKIQESCKAELAKKMQNGTVIDCRRMIKEFHEGQELFSAIIYSEIKIKLSDVSKDPIDDSDKFMERRIKDATDSLTDFKAGLNLILDEINSTSPKPDIKALDLEANVKKFQRTKEKLLEMRDEEKKYPKPAEDWLYDLIRCRFRIPPNSVKKENIEKTVEFVKQFLNKLGDKYKVIRYKNKMVELGVLALNVVYETHIAEIQIVFTDSFSKLNETHIVYDVARTKDFKALKRYFETQIAVKHYKSLFESLSMHTIMDLPKIMTKEGSVFMIPLITILLANPEYNDTLDIPVTVKGKYSDNIIESTNSLKLTVALLDCEVDIDGWPSYLCLRLVIEQEDDSRNYLTGSGIRYEGQIYSDVVLKEEQVEVKGVSEGAGNLMLIVYSNTNKKIKQTFKCQLIDKTKSVIIDGKDCGFYEDNSNAKPIDKNPSAKLALSSCPQGHRLLLTQVAQEYNCSKCNNKAPQQKHPSCGSCNFHVCRTCIGVPGSGQTQQLKAEQSPKNLESQNNAQTQEQQKSKNAVVQLQSQPQSQPQTHNHTQHKEQKCPDGHVMKVLALDDRLCDECSDEIEHDEKHYVCKRCNYDICNYCANGEKRGDSDEEGHGNIPTKDQDGRIHCLNDHIMTRASRDGGYCSCDVCEEDIDDDEEHHICFQCNYDLCNNCLATKVKAKSSSLAGSEQTEKFKCPSGHVACLMAVRNRCCDLCREDIKASDKHPICEDCDYDVCSKCVKIITTKSKPQDGYYILEYPLEGNLAGCKFKCPVGHQTPFLTVYYHSCDLCRTDISSSEKHPLCEDCDYDVCLNCVNNIVANTKPEAGFYSLAKPVDSRVSGAKFKCPSGHATHLIAAGYRSCNLCGESISAAEKHPLCEECEYDVCLNCVTKIFDKTKPNGGFYSLEAPVDSRIATAKFKCPSDHPTPLKAKDYHSCDLCGNTISSSEKHPICKECNYDVCCNCVSDIMDKTTPNGGYYSLVRPADPRIANAKFKCQKGHPTALKAESDHSCDLCGSSIGASDKHPLCSKCDFDVCNDCVVQILDSQQPKEGYYKLTLDNDDDDDDDDNKEEQEEDKDDNNNDDDDDDQ